jgi:hypothetical protein
VVQGSWAQRQAVGSKVVTTGQLLGQRYYRDPKQQYFEVDIDLASSSASVGALHFVTRPEEALALVMEMALVLEDRSSAGKKPLQVVLGSARVQGVQL